MDHIEIFGKWLGIIAGIIVSIGILSAPIIYVVRKMLTISENMKSLGEWNLKQQQDIEDGAAEHQIIIESILAALRGLSEQGCNGPVTAGIAKLETYMLKRTCQVKSRKCKLEEE